MGGAINVYSKKAGQGTVFMVPSLYDMLEGRLKTKNEETPLIFPNKKLQKQISVSNTYKRVVEELGFNNGVEDNLNKVVFHTLRHTFASFLASRGTSLLAIKELMRHKNIEMTMRYAHLIPDIKKDAVHDMATDYEKKVNISIANKN